VRLVRKAMQCSLRRLRYSQLVRGARRAAEPFPEHFEHRNVGGKCKYERSSCFPKTYYTQSHVTVISALSAMHSDLIGTL
jgi:hypothetical protein